MCNIVVKKRFYILIRASIELIHFIKLIVFKVFYCTEKVCFLLLTFIFCNAQKVRRPFTDLHVCGLLFPSVCIVCCNQVVTLSCEFQVSWETLF